MTVSPTGELILLSYIAGMASRPPIDQRVDRFQTTITMPVTLKRQVDDYASQMAIPINSAMIVLLDRSLQAAGYPGVSGSPVVPSVITNAM